MTHSKVYGMKCSRCDFSIPKTDCSAYVCKMVLPKSKQSAGLGNSLMNDRFGRGRGADQKKVSAIQRTGPGGETVSAPPFLLGRTCPHHHQKS